MRALVVVEKVTTSQPPTVMKKKKIKMQVLSTIGGRQSNRYNSLINGGTIGWLFSFHLIADKHYLLHGLIKCVQYFNG